ncbi:hypothetical protein SGLAM104S_03531 [Streptomyces glaucescens]
MRNTFFNANDDVLKIYHSDVDIDNTVVWKNENRPVIQRGWTPRNIDDVRASNTHAIHNRMYCEGRQVQHLMPATPPPTGRTWARPPRPTRVPG